MMEKQIYVLAFSIFIVATGFGIITPLMPYYRITLGISESEFGLLTALFALVQFIFMPVMGGVTDRMGRKPLIILGLLGFALSHTISGLAHKFFLFLARGLQGFFMAVITPAVISSITDVTKPRERATAMGVFTVGMEGGVIIGPAIGGALFVFFESYQFLFFICASLAVLSAVSVHLIVRETLDKSIKRERRNVTPLTLLSDIRFALAVGGTTLTACFIERFISNLYLSLLQTYLALYLPIIWHFNPLQFGFIWVPMGIAAGIGSLIFGKMADVKGRKLMIMLGGLIGSLFTFAFIFLPSVHNLYGFEIAYIFLIGITIGRTLAGNMRGPAATALAGDITYAPDLQKERGRIMGTMTAIGTLGQIVGSIAAGVLFQVLYAYPMFLEFPFILEGILLVIFLIVAFVWITETLPSKQKEI